MFPRFLTTDLNVSQREDPFGGSKRGQKSSDYRDFGQKSPDYAYGLLTYIRGSFFDTNGTLAATANIPMGPTCPVLNALLYVSDSLVV